MLRGDMDALPIDERTGLVFASQATAETPAGQNVPVIKAETTCLVP
jgi:metal-dependent amidase/aminoacylase/carboxypeptidase family protein